MVRGTFANVRLKNQLAPGTEGGVTRHLPDGAPMRIFDAAMQYQEEGMPLVVLAGKEYGSGSSRDWAAKGTEPARRARRSSRRATSASTAATSSAWASCRLQFKPGENAAVARADRRGGVRHRRSRRGAASQLRGSRERSTVTAKRADGQPSRRSRPSSASTRRRKCSTTSTAASCRMCCGNCWRATSSGLSRPAPVCYD